MNVDSYQDVILTVDLPERGIGEGEDVDVSDECPGRQFLERELHGLRRPHMTRPDGRREDEDARLGHAVRITGGCHLSLVTGHSQGPSEWKPAASGK